MQITKQLLDLILQFRCPNGDFDSFDAKAMQNHLLICGKTNPKLLHHQQLTSYQNLPLVKIKEEVEEIKIEDTLDEPKIPVQPASKIDEDSKALFNSLIGKLDEISVPRGVPYSRFGPPAPPKKLFVPVNGPAVPTVLRPDFPLTPRVLPTQPDLLVKPKLLKPVKPAPYHLWKSDKTFCESKENEELTQLRPDLPPTSLSPRGLARHNLPAQPSFLVRPKLLEPVWKSDNNLCKSIDEDLQVMFQFLLTF